MIEGRALSHCYILQLEDGQYAASLQSCKTALALLSSIESDLSETETALRTKLVARRLRLLMFLYADDPSYLEELKDELLDLSAREGGGELLWSAVKRRRAARGMEHAVNVRLAAQPRYRHPLSSTNE